MLQTDDPAETLRELLAEREPVYAQADLTVQSREAPHDTIVSEIVAALAGFLKSRRRRRQPDRTAQDDGRAASTPARADPVTVAVALGERSYDIVIGRGLLGSLGARIEALRPGAKTIIVTDENVARHHLAAAETRSAAPAWPPAVSWSRRAKPPRAFACSSRSARR